MLLAQKLLFLLLVSGAAFRESNDRSLGKASIAPRGKDVFSIMNVSSLAILDKLPQQVHSLPFQHGNWNYLGIFFVVFWHFFCFCACGFPLLFCFPRLLCFSAFLLLCFSASLLFCFSASLASLLFYFSDCLPCFSLVKVFACSSSLLSYVFAFFVCLVVLLYFYFLLLLSAVLVFCSLLFVFCFCLALRF